MQSYWVSSWKIKKTSTPKLVIFTVAVLATVLWGTNTLTQTDRQTLNCEQLLGGYQYSGFLTTTWNNGRTYKEKVFLTRSDGVYYLRWDNSKDWFLLNLSDANFEFKRGNNWQLFNGTCTTRQGAFGKYGTGASTFKEIVGSAFSFPDQVSGTFILQL